ncbi:hypothetical protein [Sulfodiicoccus acidiphilus]|uniref:hypothetical protein n=1 Tax=Sulfodiicoccus acidiphilus TaxID=1670455 RepID=UPI001E381858|nr:hypothetical protein [Sulfodiicoccus acidiphilus]
MWRSREISGIIQPMGGEATVTSLLNRLVKMGLVEKIPTLGRENYYKVSSRPLDPLC